jgi:hypothetical protein
MGGLGLFDSVQHLHDPDDLFAQELAYYDHQQAMTQRYGQNRSHVEYIADVRARRNAFSQQS